MKARLRFAIVVVILLAQGCTAHGHENPAAMPAPAATQGEEKAKP